MGTTAFPESKLHSAHATRKLAIDDCAAPPRMVGEDLI
jgi:hypothetical protein